MPIPTASEVHATATEQPAALHFSAVRAPAHRLVFSNLTETEQAIYAYDYEADSLNRLFALPPEISLHRQPEVVVKDDGGNEIPISLPKGLGLHWLFISPDGRTLAALQPAFGGHPNYLHQIDLGTGQVTSIKLLEKYEWTIPIVAGRDPNPLDFVLPGGEAQASVASVFDALAWAPDSSGFVFTIGNTVGPINGMYYVARGVADVVPMGAMASGEDIGQRATWSPDGRSVAYARNPSGQGIWLIDLAKLDAAIRIAELPIPNFVVWTMKWSKDGQALVVGGDGRDENGVEFAAALLVGRSSGSVRELARLQPTPGASVALYVQDLPTISEGALFMEDHFKMTATGSEVVERRLVFADANSGAQSPLVVDKTLRLTSASSCDPRLLVVYGEPCVGVVMEIPSGEVSVGPRESLCMGGKWAPDGRLVGGLSRGDIVVWDLERGSSVTVAREFEGEKLVLGWFAER